MITRDLPRDQVSAFDIMCWAICCGATKLALFMWRRTSSPLRAALIGQQLCERFGQLEYSLDHAVRSALKKGEDEFNEAMYSLLSMVAASEKTLNPPI